MNSWLQIYRFLVHEWEIIWRSWWIPGGPSSTVHDGVKSRTLNPQSGDSFSLDPLSRHDSTSVMIDFVCPIARAIALITMLLVDSDSHIFIIFFCLFFFKKKKKRTLHSRIEIGKSVEKEIFPVFPTSVHFFLSSIRKFLKRFLLRMKFILNLYDSPTLHGPPLSQYQVRGEKPSRCPIDSWQSPYSYSITCHVARLRRSFSEHTSKVPTFYFIQMEEKQHLAFWPRDVGTWYRHMCNFGVSRWTCCLSANEFNTTLLNPW